MTSDFYIERKKPKLPENISKEELQKLLIKNNKNCDDFKEPILDNKYHNEGNNECNNKIINMNKWWNSYLAIAKKVESNGSGNDHIDITTIIEMGNVDNFSKHIPSSKYENVLDLGCGDGTETKMLIDKGYKVTGVTLGVDNIKMAKELYNINLLEMDMNVLNFTPNSFDAIYMSHSFEHVLSPFITCIEIWRVLKCYGKCYISVPSPDNSNSYDGMWHYNLLYENQIIKLFEMCGFKLVEYYKTGDEKIDTVCFNFIFEKLSINKIQRWNYLRHIHKLRNEI